MKTKLADLIVKNDYSTMNSARAIMLVMMLVAAGCASSAEPKDDESYDVVTANEQREQLDSKTVVVKGWLSLQPEAKCILQNEYVDGANVPLEEGVTVSYNKSMQSEMERLDGSRVEISGTFHKNILDSSTIVVGACNETAIDVKSITPIN